MTYCTKCGAELPEDAFFCPKCGHRTMRGEEAGVQPLRPRRVYFGGSRRYRVKDSKSYSGKIETPKVFFHVDNINGPVHVSGWEKLEYSIELDIEARGYTEEEAEENLRELQIELKEEVKEEETRLILEYDYPRYDGSYSIGIDVKLPLEAEVGLDVGSSNGGIDLKDLSGDVFEVRTSNGRIILEDLSANSLTGRTSNGRIEYRAEVKETYLRTSNGNILVSKMKGDILEAHTSNGRIFLEDVSAKKITAKTSNGIIEGRVDSEDANLSTSNGKIELAIPCTTSGDYTLRTSKGSIELDLPSRHEVGYDLDLHTSRGRIRIDMPDLEHRWMGRTQVRAKTHNYDAKDIQISIDARTSIAGIRVNS